MRAALTDLLREWMPHQRWFGSKGREWAEVSEDGFLLDRPTRCSRCTACG